MAGSWDFEFGVLGLSSLDGARFVAAGAIASPSGCAADQMLHGVHFPAAPESLGEVIHLESHLVELLPSLDQRLLVPVGQFQSASRCLSDLDRILQLVRHAHIVRIVRVGERAGHRHCVSRSDAVDAQRRLAILEHRVVLVLVDHQQRLKPPLRTGIAIVTGEVRSNTPTE